ncbi:MAG: catechol 1,2-dioxygenase [Flavobacteriaceae bacterium]|nr:MAG: catechol 1,2-dioxygenase [Flavobacteriaceae bacterium]
MKRGAFTKLTGLSVIAISTTGFIRFNGKSYEGDCETTSDILGPFYRPDSPVRDNLVLLGMPGDIVELTGVIRHKDCQTPHKNAKVELWHCSSEEIYDNDSDEFRYRGTTYCDDNGMYKFKTQMPVPYDAGGGLIRPAHFHMMVSAPGYQSFVTQIYFQGDPYVEKDPWSAASKAQYRKLKVEEENGTKKVVFDCNINDKLKASISALNQIVGKYKNDTSEKVMEFFERNGQLWSKNEVFGERYAYVGENKFEYSGMPTGLYEKLQFDFKQVGTIKLQLTAVWENGKEIKELFTKL